MSYFDEIDPRSVFYTHAKLFRHFPDGRSLAQTLFRLRRGVKNRTTELPCLTVLRVENSYFGKNNELLWVLKGCAEAGLFLFSQNLIRMRVKNVPLSRKTRNLTPTRATLHARFVWRDFGHRPGGCCGAWEERGEFVCGDLYRTSARFRRRLTRQGQYTTRRFCPCRVVITLGGKRGWFGCCQALQAGHLDCLIFLREVEKCDWHMRFMPLDAIGVRDKDPETPCTPERLACLRYARDNGCSWQQCICSVLLDGCLGQRAWNSQGRACPACGCNKFDTTSAALLAVKTLCWDVVVVICAFVCE